MMTMAYSPIFKSGNGNGHNVVFSVMVQALNNKAGNGPISVDSPPRFGDADAKALANANPVCTGDVEI